MTDIRMSEIVELHGSCGGSVGAVACPGTVVVETDDVLSCTDCHLTPAQARELARHLVLLSDLAETWDQEESNAS